MEVLLVVALISTGPRQTRDKPGIDQHQHRALRPDLRDIDSVIKRCSAAGRLRVTKRRLNRSAQAGD
eukprot:COSAG02_NODE_7448_length_3009_cov_2.048454_3_plen_67_part_00